MLACNIGSRLGNNPKVVLIVNLQEFQSDGVDGTCLNGVAVAQNGNMPVKVYGVSLDSDGFPYTIGDREIKVPNPIKVGDILINKRDREITVTHIANDMSFAYEYKTTAYGAPKVVSGFMSINDVGYAAYGIKKEVL